VVDALFQRKRRYCRQIGSSRWRKWRTRATSAGVAALPAASAAGSAGITQKIRYVMIVATKNRKMAQKIRRMRNCVMDVGMNQERLTGGVWRGARRRLSRCAAGNMRGFRLTD